MRSNSSGKGFGAIWLSSISILLMLSCALFVVTTNAVIADFVDGDYEYTISSGGATITGYTGPGGIIIIPSILGGYLTVAIGGGAFANDVSLTSVTIPVSVRTIGYGAFQGCSSLTSVIIPSSVTSIEGIAFSSCSSLTSVAIPNSVTSIGNWAFQSCSSLTSVTIPNSVKYLGAGAFYDCTSLTSVIIPSSVSIINNWTFQFCPLISVIIPEGVTSIEASAFCSCTNLTSVTIPNSIISIGRAAFASCKSLTSISILASIRTFGAYVFYNCTSLTSITFFGLAAPTTVGSEWITGTDAGIRGHASAYSNFPAPGAEFFGLTMGSAVGILLHEDFENTTLADWINYDNNPSSGFDFWGTSSYRSHLGSRSCWCGEVGNNSVNGTPNIDGRHYDQNMTSVLEFRLGELSDYEHVEIDFFYWAVTGTYNVDDGLCFLGGNSSGWRVIWHQSVPRTNGWEEVHVELNREMTDISFTFTSDDNIGLGPYEGVYIDDVLVSVSGNAPPETTVLPLPQWQNASEFLIAYQETDVGGGLDFVQLYYRHNSVGEFMLYTAPSNPEGHWDIGAIFFSSDLTGGEGYYEFYTVGIDKVGMIEAQPSGPDAYTVIDLTPPSTHCSIAGEAGYNGWYRSGVNITLSGTDNGSGIDQTKYRINAGDWKHYSGTIGIQGSGIYLIEFLSTDKARLQEHTANVTIRIDTRPPEITIDRSSDSVHLQGLDNESGVLGCSYMVDSGPPRLCSSQGGIILSGFEPGEHTVVFIVDDRAGNENSTLLSFIVPIESHQTNDGVLTVVLAGAIAVFTMGIILVRRRKRK